MTIAVIMLLALSATASAVSTEYQNAGVAGDIRINSNQIDHMTSVLIICNTADKTPTYGDIRYYAFLLGVAADKLIVHYPTVELCPSIRINPNLYEMAMIQKVGMECPGL
jgi:hypothetical protein